MSIILNIDTSLETASVSIAKDAFVLASLVNTVQKDHASFLHNAIRNILHESALDLQQVEAIAVTIGPGSYTGLRVGLASAKGLCYALNKPLITIGTLNALAKAAIDLSGHTLDSGALFCPMIDARRMEVFTAVFDAGLKEILPPCAMILQENSFKDQLQNNHVLFCGNGASKWEKIAGSEKASFINELDPVPAISYLSNAQFLSRKFADLSYSEPLYVKEFFTP